GRMRARAARPRTSPQGRVFSFMTSTLGSGDRTDTRPGATIGGLRADSGRRAGRRRSMVLGARADYVRQCDVPWSVKGVIVPAEPGPRSGHPSSGQWLFAVGTALAIS